MGEKYKTEENTFIKNIVEGVQFEPKVFDILVTLVKKLNKDDKKISVNYKVNENNILYYFQIKLGNNQQIVYHKESFDNNIGQVFTDIIFWQNVYGDRVILASIDNQNNWKIFEKQLMDISKKQKKIKYLPMKIFRKHNRPSLDDVLLEYDIKEFIKILNKGDLHSVDILGIQYDNVDDNKIMYLKFRCKNNKALPTLDFFRNGYRGRQLLSLGKDKHTNIQTGDVIIDRNKNEIIAHRSYNGKWILV